MMSVDSTVTLPPVVTCVTYKITLPMSNKSDSELIKDFLLSPVIAEINPHVPYSAIESKDTLRIYRQYPEDEGRPPLFIAAVKNKSTAIAVLLDKLDRYSRIRRCEGLYTGIARADINPARTLESENTGKVANRGRY